jgi:hypothetical protein
LSFTDNFSGEFCEPDGSQNARLFQWGKVQGKVQVKNTQMPLSLSYNAKFLWPGSFANLVDESLM